MEFEIVASGLLFPGGPVVLSDGSVLLVEIARGTLTSPSPARGAWPRRAGRGPN